MPVGGEEKFSCLFWSLTVYYCMHILSECLICVWLSTVAATGCHRLPRSSLRKDLALGTSLGLSSLVIHIVTSVIDHVNSKSFPEDTTG